MTEAFPWSFKGIHHETRDVARAAARRSGKSLSAWLDDVILEKADVGRELVEEDDASMRRRGTRARPYSRPERDRGRLRRAPALRRDEEDDETTTRGRRRDDVDAKAIVDDAVAIFERRAAESERKTAKALSGLARLIENNHTSRSRLGDELGAVFERLGRIEERVSARPDAEAARPIRSALARLEERIDRLSSDERAYEFESALGALDQRLADIAARLDEDAEERRTEAARRQRAIAAEEQPRLQERERRTAPARRPLADAIAEITERQRTLEEQAGAIAPPRHLAEARPPAVFDGLAESIEALSRQLAATRADQSFGSDQQAAVAAQIELLRRELDGVSRALIDLAPRASVTAVEAALLELSDRVEAQRFQGVEERVLAPVERLAADLRAILRELDPSRIVATLYEEVRALGDKLAEHRAEGGEDRAALGEIAGETREIHELLKAVARRPLPIEKIEAGLAALTTHVEELSASGAGRARAQDVSELVHQIRSTVSAEIGGSFTALERRLEEFAAKLDSVSTKSGGGGKRFDEINERIEQVHKSLAARIERSSGASVDPGQFERLFASLAKKIDAAAEAKIVHPGFDELGRKIEKLEQRLQPTAAGGAQKQADSQQLRELADRIDHVHSELASRIDASARRRAEDASHPQLAELVGQLAQRMDAALDPDADRQAFAALERQIGRLAERLDRTDANAASLSTIEQALGALATQVEETRDSTARVAEIAARQAAEDAVRDATMHGGLQDALEKELVELRNFQDEAGHRTNQTLAAVHETLQRVVERLTMFEDELTDLRKTRVIAPLQAPRAKEEAAPRRDARAKPAVPVADVEDILLEPGDRRPRREPSVARETRAEPERAGAERASADRSNSVQADFIAAARRAAQQAAVEAQAAAAQGKAAQGKAAKKAAAAAERQDEREQAAVGGAKGIGAALQSRRRPLLLGVGVLVLLYGAYQIARVSIDAPAPQAAATQMEPGEGTASASAEKSSAADASKTTEPTDSKDAAPAPAAAAAEPTPTTPPAAAPASLGAPSLAPGGAGVGAFATQPASPLPGRFGARLLESKPGETRPVDPKLADSKAAVDPMPVGAIGNGAPAPAPAAVLATIKEIAAAGDASAQYELGLRYAEGRGGAPRDQKLALHWLEKAASKGLAPAQYRLGSIYEKGVGVERDYAQAISWYKRAADAGNARAMHNLAVLYAGGGDGKPDYEQAAQWFRKAAEYGVRDSQFNLAILYARGMGAPQSLTQSYLWFSAAAAQGDDDAAKKRDEVKARLDSKDLAAAKALAEGFHPKQPDSLANDVPPPPGGWENAKAPAKPETRPVGRPKVSAL